MRELLSKMYFNFGQSLRAEKRWTDAKKAALDRRTLWTGNADRLLGVASELADLRTAALKSPDSKDEIKLIDRDVLETLQQSYDCGWPREIDLGADKQFA